MEHLQHFGLTQDPFSNESDLRLYFESPTHRDAQRRVERGLRQHKGLTLLTGEGGMGKTLLARRILDGLEEEIFESTLLVMLPGAADATGIFQRFARQLGADEPARDRAGLLSQIYERLAIVREDGRHAVLIVDDAQVMSPQVFAELGGLLSLEYEDRRLMSMLLVGSLELDRQIQNDASLLPRVDVRVRIRPLDLASAAAYLRHRLTVARGRPELIPSATLEALYKFGRGRPRLLNTLADNALFEAYLAGRLAIEPGDVERAAADLGVDRDVMSGSDVRATSARASVSIPAPAPSIASPAPADPELILTEELPASAWGMGSKGDFDLDLDLLDGRSAAASKMSTHATPRSVGSTSTDVPLPGAASGRNATVPRASQVVDPGGDPELDGLFVELIEE